MLELSKVHHFKNARDEETGAFRTKLVGVHPYVRITHEKEPPIFVQEGHFYYGEHSSAIDPITLPEWFWPEAAKIGEKVRKECKLEIPDEYSDPVSVRDMDTQRGGKAKRA